MLKMRRSRKSTARGAQEQPGCHFLKCWTVAGEPAGCNGWLLTACRAATPVKTKIPAPMEAPTPMSVRSTAPRARTSPRGLAIDTAAAIGTSTGGPARADHEVPINRYLGILVPTEGEDGILPFLVNK